MVTCQICGNYLAKGCTCFSGIKWFKEYYRLAMNEMKVIDKVRIENKPLYIEIKENGLKKQAKIKVLNKYTIQATAEFTSAEIGKLEEYSARLLDWNNNLIYWHSYSKSNADKEHFEWTLNSKSKINRVIFKFLNKLMN